jgi:hypothetical protein
MKALSLSIFCENSRKNQAETKTVREFGAHESWPGRAGARTGCKMLPCGIKTAALSCRRVIT